jgi:hypothetical protein
VSRPTEVTIASLVGSLVVGIFVAMHADASIGFGLLSVWLVLRMCLATIDGTLAIDAAGLRAPVARHDRQSSEICRHRSQGRNFGSNNRSAGSAGPC